jgi:hypothetical protein
MIPAFDQYGYLPEGVYDCTIEEAGNRFGTFQNTDRRPQLWGKFIEFVREAESCGFVDAILLDGSFVTAENQPNDIDLVLIAAANHDFSAELSPAQYNLLVQRRVRRRFGFDIVVVKDRSRDLEEAIAFFQQVKQRPGITKGILRIRL